MTLIAPLMASGWTFADLREHDLWELAIAGKVLERYEILRNPIPDEVMRDVVSQGKGEMLDARERYDREREKIDGGT